MVWSVIQNVRQGLKFRGGWRGLMEHMYANGDYPFKFGTFMGADAAGNRYYENREDYPFGQHRWIEPSDIHNFDSSQVDPEWHGWMLSVNDATPSQDEAYIKDRLSHAKYGEVSHVPTSMAHNVGHQEPYFNFHNMHNQSQIRSRGYGIGNPIVGLPPGAPDGYYTQPGSPYNDASIRPLTMQGDLDEAVGGGRAYKNAIWKERLKSAAEKTAETTAEEAKWTAGYKQKETAKRLSPREQAILARGGTLSK